MKEIWGHLKKLVPQEEREQRALIISGVSLIIAFVVILIAKLALGVTSDVVLVSLLLLPTVAYMVISGKIEEFKFGEIATKFARAANTSIASEIVDAYVIFDEAEIILKPEEPDFQDKLDQIKERLQTGVSLDRPIVSPLKLGWSLYDREHVSRYIQGLSQLRNFKLVIFERNDRCEAYISSRAIKGLISKQALGEEFINVVKEGLLEELLQYPGVSKPISIRSTNAQALREMVRQKAEAVTVVDENHRFKGVVALERLLVSMVSAQPSDG